jgi:hypothetical protein
MQQNGKNVEREKEKLICSNLENHFIKHHVQHTVYSNSPLSILYGMDNKQMKKDLSELGTVPV